LTVVCDTGVLVGAASTRDRHHEACVAALDRWRSTGLVVPVTVAVEVDYLLRGRVGEQAARGFLDDLNLGRFLLEPVGAATFARATAIDRQYADLGLGLVDGTVIAVAEDLGSQAILTLDHGHFRVAASELTLDPGEDDL
jgi:predicted nucleic acid-binding protein